MKGMNVDIDVNMPAQETGVTRLRTSCDACQNLKVKCSQDKPSCRRCSKNGLDCVYSPLRRMGRPKRPFITSSSSPVTAATPRSHSQSHGYQRRRDDTTTTHSPAFVIHPQATGHTPSGMEDLFGTGPSFGLDNGGLGSDRMYGGKMVLGAEDDTLTGSPSGIFLEERAKTASFINSGFFPFLPDLDGPPALTRQQPRLLTSPLATLVDLDSHTGTQEQSTSSNDDQTTREAGHCYLAILNRLTQLEATLDTGPRPPCIDVILSAERDTRLLKERIFACQGHGTRELDMVSSPTAPRERSPQGCIDAHGSSLLVLSLLAERVTGLFEDLFRRAAVSSHSMDLATQGITAPWLYGSVQGFASQADERQYERSVRSSFSRNIHCPVPEANCELTIGNYEVDAEVKSRVMKLILKQRVGALEKMLGDLRDYLMDGAGQDDRPGRERNRHTASENGSILLGSVKSSRALNQDATAYMVENLHRRAEMLRGRLELAGH